MAKKILRPGIIYWQKYASKPKFSRPGTPRSLLSQLIDLLICLFPIVFREVSSVFEKSAGLPDKTSKISVSDKCPTKFVRLQCYYKGTVLQSKLLFSTKLPDSFPAAEKKKILR